MEIAQKAHKGVGFTKTDPTALRVWKRNQGKRFTSYRRGLKPKNSVDTNYARNTSQVSEACPFECINTEGIFVVGKVQITLDAWKELTSGKLILDTVQRVSVSFESDLN